MKNKDLKPRLLYAARLSFKKEGEIKNFPDQKIMAKTVQLHQTSISKVAKGTALRTRRRKERENEREEHRYKGGRWQ